MESILQAIALMLVVVFASEVTAQGVPAFEPLSSRDGIEVIVDERSPLGTEVVVVRAQGSFMETVVYGIDLLMEDEGVFEIDSLSGNITVGVNGSNKIVVRGGIPTVFTFDVFAYFQSSGLSGSRAYLPVTVNVRDFNDRPFFPQGNVTLSVLETVGVGTTIARVMAIDDDLSNNGILTYSLTQLNPNNPTPSFTIHPLFGDLSVSNTIDADIDYQLIITATDGGVPPLSGTSAVVVRVDPLPPVFEQTSYSISIVEFTGQIPVSLTTVRANSLEGNVFYSISSIVPRNEEVTFFVGLTSGELSVNGTFDRETVSRYFVTVDAALNEEGSSPAQTIVIVTVLDANEPPVFVSSHYVTSVPEGAAIGTQLFAGILALDTDEGSNSVFSYSISSILGHQTLDGTRISISMPVFLISPSTGIITVNTSLQREAQVDGFHYYEITVVATDTGSPPLSSNTTLTVSVTDINDNAPEFSDTSFNFDISENLPPGTEVGVLRVTDRDFGASAEILFTLTGLGSERFSVEVVNVTQMSISGSQPPIVTTARVIASQPLDREETEQYQFNLVAEDRSSVPLSATVPVVVSILDVNDNSPLFPSPFYSFSINEATENTLVMEFDVTDVDDGVNGVVDFSVDPAVRSLFGVRPISNLSGDLLITHSLDRETRDSYSFTLLAIDRGSPPLTGQTAINITIVDANDNAPVFNDTLFTFALLENLPALAMVGGFEATDSDLDTGGEISFTILGMHSDRFAIEVLNVRNPTRGRILTTRSLDREDVAVYQLTLVAEDRGISPLSTTVPLIISVIDQNDNSPAFSQNMWSIELTENTNGTIVMDFNVTDPDFGTNGAVDFTLDPSADGLFSIMRSGPQSTLLILTHYLDRERTDSYTFTISAMDRGTPSLSGQTVVTINVLDENDNSPQFNITALSEEVVENAPAGTFIVEFDVTDIDAGLAAEANFSLTGIGSERFSVDVVSINQVFHSQSSSAIVTRGRISTAQVLDREERGMYQLMLVAQDLTNLPLSASVPVVITVVDTNDNSPIFAQPVSSFSLPENIDSAFIMEFNVTDADIGSNSAVDFSLETHAQGLFSLENTGPLSFRLYLSHRLDRETTSSYSFRIFAIDNGMPPLVGQTDVMVIVQDENDNAPIFTRAVYEISVTENLPVGYVIDTVVANDADTGSNGQVAYYSSPQQLVEINNTTGEVILVISPDFETLSTLTLQVFAFDFGTPQNSANATIVITISDANDFAPVFQQDQVNVTISEGILVTSQVVRTSATDGDLDTITYQIVVGNELDSFVIDNVTGVISVNEPLDRELSDSYTLQVVALDSGLPPLSSVATVCIEISDENDNSPVFIGDPYTASIREGLNGSAGAFVLAVTAIDADIGENGDVEYSLFGAGTLYFIINSATGDIHVSSSGLDFESIDSMDNPLQLVVIAQDNGTFIRFTAAAVNITVLDDNDNAPLFINAPYSATLLEGPFANTTPILNVSAEDADSGTNGEVVYSLAGGESEIFQLDPNTGLVSIEAGVSLDRDSNLIPHNDNGDAVFTFGVAAMDLGIPALISYTTVSVLVSDINDNTPILQSDFIDLTLSESIPIGTPVLNLVATDNDFGINGLVNYTIIREESAATGIITEGFSLAVDESTGLLSLAQALDRETVPYFRVLVVVTDQGPGFNQATATITVNVTDSNDNRPIFSIPPGGYEEAIPENTTLGTEIITVTASDLDDGENQEIRYLIQTNTSDGQIPFSIPDPRVGTIVLSDVLDREMVAEYLIVVIARDSAENSQEGFATVRIIIEDVNDNAPLLNSDMYVGIVREGAEIGTVVQVTPPILASDPDTTPFMFVLVGENIEGFSIDPVTGEITTEASLDYELMREYPDLLLIVFDEDFLFDNATLCINVVDENDNTPVFNPNEVALSVSENAPVGSEIFLVTATDLDDGTNAQLAYSLSTVEVFSINAASGAITVSEELDFESQASYLLEIVATDGGQPARNSTLMLNLTISDENDNPPMITNPSPVYTIMENVGTGFLVGSVNAIDVDSGNNSELRYEIIAGNVGNRFFIDPESGTIFTNGIIDREEQDAYTLTVEARDSAAFPLADQTVVTVEILDENDNLPFFIDLPTLSISELTPADSVVDTLNAGDNDEGSNANITYSIGSAFVGSNVPFQVEASTGIITTSSILDYETQNVYSIIITAMDQGVPALSSSVFATITILDENDNAPQFSRQTNVATIPEHSSFGSFVINLGATDADSGTNAQLVYSIVGDSGSIVRIDSGTGIVTVQNSSSLDYETQRMFVVQVQAEDMGIPSLSSRVILIVNLTDVNDNSPQFPSILPLAVEENRVIGSTITVLMATDRDQGSNAALSYSITSGDDFGQFDVLEDGSLVLRLPLDYESIESYNLVISAMDSGFPPLSGTTSVVISVLDANDNVPVFSGFQTTFNAPEDIAFGSEVIRVEATDLDSGSNRNILYRLVNIGGINSPFVLDPATGSMTVQQPLDRETISEYMFIIEAADSGIPSLATQREVTLIILDVNDNAPIFSESPSFTITEDQAEDTPFGFLDTMDADEGSNAIPYYFITGGDNVSFVNVDAISGLVFLTAQVDYDAGETELVVQLGVWNQNFNPGPACQPSPCTTATLVIQIEDVNDNPPIFTETEYHFSLNRSSPDSVSTGIVQATDIDTSDDFGRVQYRINQTSMFSIGLDSGVIRLAEYNPVTDSNFIEVNVTAFDNLGNDPSLTSSEIVKVYFIEDENLAVITVEEQKALVDMNLNQILRSLEDITSRSVRILVYDTREYSVTTQVLQPNRKRQDVATIVITRTNITIYGVNNNTKTVLNSSDVVQYVNDRLETRSIGPFSVESITILPQPSPSRDLSFFTYIYIAVGVVGGILLLLVLVGFCVCCYCCRGKKQKYRPSEGVSRHNKKYASPNDPEAYENPTWDDPYFNSKNWSEDVDTDTPVTYNERSVDDVNGSLNRKYKKQGKRQEYAMDEMYSTQNKDEMTVEIKPDQQSLSHASTTLERRSKAASDRDPLVPQWHPPPPPQGGSANQQRRSSRDSAIKRVQPVLDFTAAAEDDADLQENLEEVKKEDMSFDASEKVAESEDEEELSEDEEYSEDEDSRSEDEEELSEDEQEESEDDEEGSEDEELGSDQESSEEDEEFENSAESSDEEAEESEESDQGGFLIPDD